MCQHGDVRCSYCLARMVSTPQLEFPVLRFHSNRTGLFDYYRTVCEIGNFFNLACTFMVHYTPHKLEYCVRCYCYCFDVYLGARGRDVQQLGDDYQSHVNYSYLFNYSAHNLICCFGIEWNLEDEIISFVYRFASIYIHG